jgi:hypothetical protein
VRTIKDWTCLLVGLATDLEQLYSKLHVSDITTLGVLSSTLVDTRYFDVGYVIAVQNKWTSSVDSIDSI